MDGGIHLDRGGWYVVQGTWSMGGSSPLRQAECESLIHKLLTATHGLGHTGISPSSFPFLPPPLHPLLVVTIGEGTKSVRTVESCQAANGGNPYTPDLLALEKCTLVKARKIPDVIVQIKTPLNIKMWQAALECHPDQNFAAYVLRAWQRGSESASSTSTTPVNQPTRTWCQ